MSELLLSTSMTPVCCIRFEKMDAAGLYQMGNHIRREKGDYRHVDETRTHLNRVILGTDNPLQDMKDHIQKWERRTGLEANIQRNVSKPYVYGIVITSGEYFRDPGQEPGEWNEVRLEAWTIAVTEHLKRQFGDHLTHVSLDLDEDVPHINFSFCPWYEKFTKRGIRSAWLSPGKWLGNINGKKGFEWHQDALAESLEHLGIDRGQRGSDVKHVRPKEHQLTIAKEQHAKQLELEAKEMGIHLIVDGQIKPAIKDDGTKTIVPTPKMQRGIWQDIVEKLKPAWEFIVAFAHRNNIDPGPGVELTKSTTTTTREHICSGHSRDGDAR